MGSSLLAARCERWGHTSKTHKRQRTQIHRRLLANYIQSVRSDSRNDSSIPPISRGPSFHSLVGSLKKNPSLTPQGICSLRVHAASTKVDSVILLWLYRWNRANCWQPAQAQHGIVIVTQLTHAGLWRSQAGKLQSVFFSLLFRFCPACREFGFLLDWFLRLLVKVLGPWLG